MNPIYTLSISFILLSVSFVSNMMAPGYLKYYVPEFKEAKAEKPKETQETKKSPGTPDQKFNVGDYVK